MSNISTIPQELAPAQAPALADLRVAYCTALETLWAASDANTAAWNAHTQGDDVAADAWDQATAAEDAASSAEREAFFAWRAEWRRQNGWC